MRTMRKGSYKPSRSVWIDERDALETMADNIWDRKHNKRFRDNSGDSTEYRRNHKIDFSNRSTGLAHSGASEQLIKRADADYPSMRLEIDEQMKIAPPTFFHGNSMNRQ